MDQPNFLPPEAFQHYAGGIEEPRLSRSAGKIEFERTKEIILRFLPPSPALIMDVGGGPGKYAFWLAARGYRVHLVDAVPLHIEQSQEAALLLPEAPLARAEVGDARKLAVEDGAAAGVLLLGPLYHLVDREERLAALKEARRVLEPGGILIAAGISRFASLLDGLFYSLLEDPNFARIVEQDLQDGQHRNPVNNPGYFTTTYFHHPTELVGEVVEAGFKPEGLFAVEGPTWLSSYVLDNWEDENKREQFLSLVRAIEQEPSMLGVSSHFLAVGRKDNRA